MWPWQLFLSVRRRRQPNALGGALSDFWDDKAQEDLAVRRHKPSQQVATAKFSQRTPADPAGPPRLVPRTLRAGLARLPLGGRTEDAGVRSTIQKTSSTTDTSQKYTRYAGRQVRRRSKRPPRSTMACGRAAIIGFLPQFWEQSRRRSRAAARGRIVDARNAP